MQFELELRDRTATEGLRSRGRLLSLTVSFILTRMMLQDPQLIQSPIYPGRKRIKQLAQGMKLSDRLSEAAQRWFNLAVSTNFVKGRKSGYVIAACLYITCRMEKTHHMLIDFSDMLQASSAFLLPSSLLSFI